MSDDTLPDADAVARTVLPSEEPARVPHDGSARRIHHGDHVGRYRIEHRLGGGGMGVVYLARDPDLDRLVAIKLLRPELAGGRQRLLREGQAIARLVHPNLVTVFDLGTLGDDLFIAMEYVPGTTLRGWLDAAPRSWREVIAQFVAAGRGLAAAHRAGVVHRDFKPDNVLISTDGRVVVSDFGLALARAEPIAPSTRPPTASGARDSTRTVGPVGTPTYMAPEQFLEAPLDARADQFSFCVALWQALFGQRPFVGDPSSMSFDQIAAVVVAGQIRPPPADHPVPARIERAVRRGLSTSPAARFPSMDPLLAALDARDRRPLYAGAALGVAAVIGVIALGSQRGGAPCELGADRLAALWSERARAAYVAGGAPDRARDAAWFDEIARRWTVAAHDACARDDGPDPRTATCLGDALGALERAVAHPDRGGAWPMLVDPGACLTAPGPAVAHELRGALGNIDPSGALAPVGGAAGRAEVAFAAGTGLRGLFAADGSTARSELLTGVTRVLGWSSDGRTLTARAGDQVVRLDVASAARTPLPFAGDVRAVADDGAIAARFEHAGATTPADVAPHDPSADAVIFTGADGRVRARVAAPDFADVAIEPGDRRAAIVGGGGDAWYLLAVELATGRTTRTALGVNGDAGGTLAVAWAAPGRLVVSGSGSDRPDEALWRLDLDDAGALRGPPIVWLPARASTIMDLLDVDGGRALVVMVDVPAQVTRVHGGHRALLPGLLDAPVRAADAEAGRVLLIDDRDAVVVDLDGAVLASSPRATWDGAHPVLRDGDLWLARADHGDVVLRRVKDAAPREVRLRGALPGPLDNMRCAGGASHRCFVSWLAPHQVRHAVVGGADAGDTLGPPFELAIEEHQLDLAPDGAHALGFDDHQIVAVDLATGAAVTLHQDARCTVDRAVWTPSGAAIVYATVCDGKPTVIRIQAARPGAAGRTLATVEAYLTGLVALGDDDIVYSSIGYDSRLVVVDGLAPP